MDTNFKRNLVGIGLLAAVGLCVALLIATSDISTVKKQRIILDSLGCQAASRLGVKVSAVDSGVCELEGRLSITVHWLTIGAVRIDSSRVVAVQDSREG